MSPFSHPTTLFFAAALALASGCAQYSTEPRTPTDFDPPEQTVGERVFLETRFAQFFAANSGGNANLVLGMGDPALDTTQTLGAPLPGPFAGKSMNCGACHLVDQQDGVAGGGIRTYCDFAPRSPIPERSDLLVTTPRNSPPLVNASLLHPGGLFFHFDGQFASGTDLVKATLTGRNYGWLPDEQAAAVAHIASVVRGDDGSDPIASEFGRLPYRLLLQPTGAVPPELTIPSEYRIDVDAASDAQILDALARLVDAYVRGLVFQQDDSGRFSGSPFDVFLMNNGLPRGPDPSETDLAYSRRLRGLIDALSFPDFVNAADGSFQHHGQDFRFGPLELQGLRAFLAEPGSGIGGVVGNCIACHPAPRFTDGGFHNVGIAQDEFDGVHGQGLFEQLFVPGLLQRSLAPDMFLPPSPAHPNALGTYLGVPSATDRERTDLGLWNVFANEDQPTPQPSLRALLIQQFSLPPAQQGDADLLPLTLALFKTPGLRDLPDSQPYMHNGQYDTIEAVVMHYVEFSALARMGQVRNPAPELSDIQITPADVASLAAFLRSLTEDYE
jgi:hypothetical protein